MIKFRKNMYISPTIDNVSKVKRKLRLGSGQISVYMIVINHDSRKLEYMHNAMLKQKILHFRDYDVVGLAGSAEECVDIVEQILKEAHEATGQYDAGAFLLGE